MRTFMTNQDNNYEILIGYAKSMLGYSFEELKRKYIRYPIHLTVYVENNKIEKGIEIRFDNQQGTISCGFDQCDRCNIAYLFFDTQIEENDFIEYLKKSYNFDFRKNRWLLDNLYLRVRDVKDFFCFYVFQ